MSYRLHTLHCLLQGGRVCTIRTSRGDDEMAACGQLGDAGLAFKPPPVLEAPPRFRELLLKQQQEAAAQRAALT
jgi:23S rRNA (adenine2503-C2)-methyltransferase